ncbi:hypothetical protein Scep_025230 [Stephania cephalantha]|uniref:Sodefrin-like factor n=1 Tax=Stephania cephalantha TaxID=152367 RepID=A0AAP0EHW3_9MAGN
MARGDMIVMIIMCTALFVLAMALVNVEAATVTVFEDDNSCNAIPVLDDVEPLPCGSCQNVELGKSFVFNSDDSTGAMLHAGKDCKDAVRATKLNSTDDGECYSVPASIGTLSLLGLRVTISDAFDMADRVIAILSRADDTYETTGTATQSKRGTTSTGAARQYGRRGKQPIVKLRSRANGEKRAMQDASPHVSGGERRRLTICGSEQYFSGGTLFVLAMALVNVEAATVTVFEDDNSCNAIPVLDDVEPLPCGSCQNVELGKSFVFNSDDSTGAMLHAGKDCKDAVRATKLNSTDDGECYSVPASIGTLSLLVDCN